jgi:hypothetical protein
MADTRRVAEEATRTGEEVQERVQSGFEAASRSLSEANRGFQAMADELTDFSKSRWEAVFQAWEQLLRVRHLGDMVEVQTRYGPGGIRRLHVRDVQTRRDVPVYSTQCRYSSKGHREKVQLAGGFRVQTAQNPNRRTGPRVDCR